MKWADELFLQTDISVSKSYSESAILKLTKMVLSINDFNTCEYGDLESDVCIGQGYLQQMKGIAIDILKCEKGDEYE